VERFGGAGWEVEMDTRLDHVVLWVADPLRSLDFYERVVGLPGVRAEEFRAGKAAFPSVRVSPDSIIDLMASVSAPGVDEVAGVSGSAGHPVHHICLAMGRDEFEALRIRLTDNGVGTSPMMERLFGARGIAPQSFYFADPDGNVTEARCYS
jgi:glyoxylase I family protein